MARSFAEIKSKIKRGEAAVLTAQEVREMVNAGKTFTLDDVDVVTCATRAIMSGTYAVFSFPLARTQSFNHAERVWLNGVPAHVGPCPNERLGVLDMMVFGTAHSRDDPNYGGGHLFRELVEGKRVKVEVTTDKVETITTEIILDDIPTARLMGTRNAFKNYSAFVNPGTERISSIFHATDFDTLYSGATVSGCGQINPIQNDPRLETIGFNTKVLINGAQGFVIGKGTRSTPEKPNLSGSADMHNMDSQYMGGFLTANGPECVVSWAVPIPVFSHSILKAVIVMDREIPLPVMDVAWRKEIGKTTYGDVWDGVDLDVKFDPLVCMNCDLCRPEAICPTRAVTFEKGKPELDRTMCFNCGLCASKCESDVFAAYLGALHFNKREVPIVMRQSDRLRALKLAEDLKSSILDGTFEITEMSERLRP